MLVNKLRLVGYGILVCAFGLSCAKKKKDKDEEDSEEGTDGAVSSGGGAPAERKRVSTKASIKLSGSALTQSVPKIRIKQFKAADTAAEIDATATQFATLVEGNNGLYTADIELYADQPAVIETVDSVSSEPDGNAGAYVPARSDNQDGGQVPLTEDGGNLAEALPFMATLPGSFDALSDGAVDLWIAAAAGLPEDASDEVLAAAAAQLLLVQKELEAKYAAAGMSEEQIDEIFEERSSEYCDVDWQSLVASSDSGFPLVNALDDAINKAESDYETLEGLTFDTDVDYGPEDAIGTFLKDAPEVLTAGEIDNAFVAAAAAYEYLFDLPESAFAEDKLDELETATNKLYDLVEVAYDGTDAATFLDTGDIDTYLDAASTQATPNADELVEDFLEDHPDVADDFNANQGIVGDTALSLCAVTANAEYQENDTCTVTPYSTSTSYQDESAACTELGGTWDDGTSTCNSTTSNGSPTGDMMCSLKAVAPAAGTYDAAGNRCSYATQVAGTPVNYSLTQMCTALSRTMSDDGKTCLPVSALH